MHLKHYAPHSNRDDKQLLEDGKIESCSHGWIEVKLTSGNLLPLIQEQINKFEEIMRKLG